MTVTSNTLASMTDSIRKLYSPPAGLVGYSMGAVVMLLTAARAGHVRRLVVGGIGAAAVERGGVDTDVLDPQAS